MVYGVIFGFIGLGVLVCGFFGCMCGVEVCCGIWMFVSGWWYGCVVNELGILDGELKYFDIEVNFVDRVLGLNDVVWGVDCVKKLFCCLIVDLIVCIGIVIGWIGVVGRKGLMGWVGMVGWVGVVGWVGRVSVVGMVGRVGMIGVVGMVGGGGLGVWDGVIGWGGVINLIGCCLGSGLGVEIFFCGLFILLLFELLLLDGVLGVFLVVCVLWGFFIIDEFVILLKLIFVGLILVLVVLFEKFVIWLFFGCIDCLLSWLLFWGEKVDMFVFLIVKKEIIFLGNYFYKRKFNYV